jgi:hypothetical protein
MKKAEAAAFAQARALQKRQRRQQQRAMLAQQQTSSSVTQPASSLSPSVHSVPASSFYKCSVSTSVTSLRQQQREQEQAVASSKNVARSQHTADLSAAHALLAADARARRRERRGPALSRQQNHHRKTARVSSSQVSAAIKAAEQQRELLSPEQAAEIDAAGPTPITPARKGQIYEELALSQSAACMGQRACACCMTYAFNHASEERRVDSLPGSALLQHMRQRLCEREPRLHPEVAAFYTAVSVDAPAARAAMRPNVFECLSGLLLYPPGLRVASSCGYIVLCNACLTSLQDNRRKAAPRFSIAAGFAIGPQPACILEATQTEIEMTSFVSVRAVVNVVHPSGKPAGVEGGTRRQLGSHTLMHSSEPGPAASLLPRCLNAGDGLFKVCSPSPLLSCLSVCVSICVVSVCLSVCLSVCMSVCLLVVRCSSTHGSHLWSPTAALR